MSDQPLELERRVREMFSVRQFFSLPDGGLEFQVAYDEVTKSKFADLNAELSSRGYSSELSGSKEECVLVLRKETTEAKHLSRLPVLFALFTLITLVVFALLQQLVYQQLVPAMQGFLVFFGFGVSIALTLGGHELGQRLVGGRRKGGHAYSYLIPAIPFLPPFLPSLGFVASQREPALNRDSLFDTVVAGPLLLVGLAVAFYILGDLTAVQTVVPPPHSALANSTVSINPNMIQSAIDFTLRPFIPSALPGHMLVSPIADGATAGFMIAFFGLLPMAFFDGGFLMATVGGERAARGASYLSVLALMVLDTPTYWALAVVVLLLAGRPFQLRLRDEVSGLSSSRKWLFVASVVLAFLCLPIPHNIGTLPLP